MNTDRIKNINNFVDNIINQDEWEINYNKRFDKLIIKYNNELEYYNYIKKDQINKLVIGGYIKYINMDDILLYGGALMKIDSDYLYMKKDEIIMKINKYKNIIFYRKHRTQEDKTREIFITSLDKYG
jgi:hypothetical protein